MNNNPLISIVVPVKNGAPWLHKCLQGIVAQSLFHQCEVLIIDSGSTDASIAIAEKYPVKIYNIPANEYDHGLTRNLGVNYCKGKYVVMTVQDAVAVDDLWLQRMLDGFAITKTVAGVCGQQIVPHDLDKNPVDWFRPFSAPGQVVYSFSKSDYEKLSAAKKKAACSWDNVTAMYRRDVLQEIPFRKTTYGEDAIWANDVLQAGYAIVYNTGARVYHYHQEDWDFTFKRTLTVMYFRYRHFNFLPEKPVKSLRSFLSNCKTLLQIKDLSAREKWYWFSYNQQQHKAAKAAYVAFCSALKDGDKVLDALHLKHCGKPPVPLQAREMLEA